MCTGTAELGRKYLITQQAPICMHLKMMVENSSLGGREDTNSNCMPFYLSCAVAFVKWVGYFWFVPSTLPRLV